MKPPKHQHQPKHIYLILSGKKERKKERQTPEAMEKCKNESCLRWDVNLMSGTIDTIMLII